MREFFTTYDNLFWIALCLLYPVVFLKRWLDIRKNRKKLASIDHNEEVVGTEADLRQSEEALHGFSPIEYRKELLKTHELVGRFFSTKGYTRDAINAMVQNLADKGIAIEVIEQPSVPPGVSMNFLELQGAFELYAPREKAEEAANMLHPAGF